MARGPSARVRLNRQAIEKVHLAMADGLTAVGAAVLEAADPPDATPFGIGLVTNGGYLTYRGRAKLAGHGLDGRQPRKPRSVPFEENRTQVIVGYGFPGHLQEFGTIHHEAQPFLTPASQAVLPNAPFIMGRVVSLALRKIP